MSKKDFSSDSDVFNSMFSDFTLGKVKEKESSKPVKEVKKIEKKKENQAPAVKTNISSKEESKNIEQVEIKQKTKIFDKKYRYSFYADPYLNDYLTNITWLKRLKGIPPYLNELIKKDIIEFLKISKNSTEEEIESAWIKYKKENNL